MVTVGILCVPAKSIEKEAELIESRQDPKAFVPDFLELEGKLREVEQNNKIEKIQRV